jgi:hypothetical protein
MPYKGYEEKTNDLLIAFTGYINDLNKLQQFKVSVQKSNHRLQCTKGVRPTSNSCIFTPIEN